MDFDECLIDSHLSKQLSIEYINRIAKSSIDFQNHGFNGIANILKCYVGFNRIEISSTCARLAAKTRWRHYALKFLKMLASNPYYTPLIISSGLNLAIEAKLARNILSIPVFACELEFDDTDACIQPSVIITAKAKGEITENIIASHKFSRVFAIGHSYGDIYMIRASNGIALRGEPEIEDAAQHVVSGFRDVLHLI